MAYISAEDVKAIRNELKATFPKFKFGVKKMSGGSNGVDVTVKAGPTDFSDCFRSGEGYAQINHYHTHMYVTIKHFLTKCMKLLKLLLSKEKVIGRTKAGMTTVIQ